jgi:spermidine synthase
VLGDLAARPLDDARVHVREVDVLDELKDNRLAFDLILLDVDNGPVALTQAGNARLYSQSGALCLWEALRPGGVLGVWSAGPDAAFENRLRAQRFKLSTHKTHAHGRRGKQHTIWLALKS